MGRCGAPNVDLDPKSRRPARMAYINSWILKVQARGSWQGHDGLLFVSGAGLKVQKRSLTSIAASWRRAKREKDSPSKATRDADCARSTCGAQRKDGSGAPTRSSTAGPPARTVTANEETTARSDQAARGRSHCDVGVPLRARFFSHPAKT